MEDGWKGLNSGQRKAMQDLHVWLRKRAFQEKSARWFRLGKRQVQ